MGNIFIMKRFFSFLTLSAFLIWQLFIPSFAQSTTTTTLWGFELTVPAEVIVNEAFDVTVKALDTNGQKFSTYEGTVYFDIEGGSASDIFPFNDDNEWYKFTLSDQGEHTFQKWFTIKKPGKYTIVVFEVDTNKTLEKEAEVTVVDKWGTEPTNTDVVINEPSTNTTVSTKKVTVSGTSKPTSSINIKLNGTKIKTVQTNTEGKFSVDDIWDLKEGENQIIAEVLDGNGAITGTSTTTTIKYSTEAPKLTSLVVDGGEEFFAKSSIKFIGKGDQNLKLVQVRVGDKTVELTQDTSELGTYTGMFETSEFEGEFTADVLVESQLGVKAEQKNMAKFRTVTAKIENVKIEATADKKVRFTFDITPNLARIKFFKIKYGNASEKYTKEVVTFAKDQIKEEGKYTWYIPDMQPGEYFSTIIALDENKIDTPVNSGEQTFTITLDAAPTCFIEKVSGIRVDRTSDTYSTIRWDKLNDASAYQIFKRDASGKFAMIDEVTTNEYRVNIDTKSREITYEDFQVRGICKNGTYTGEGAFSESVAVPTGPEMIIFFALFLASGIAFILVRRGYIN